MPRQKAGLLESLLQEIYPTKTASVKRADKPLSEPGGYAGESTHPSTNTDDHLIKSRTGERAAENERDVKSNRESPTVDGTPEASAPATTGTPEQDKKQLNIGTEQSSTGADASVEDDFKGTKDDPGTSSVMKADDGQKYAQYRSLPIDTLFTKAAEMGNGLLADVVNSRTGQQAPVTQAAPVAKTAAAAGHDLAAAFLPNDEEYEGFRSEGEVRPHLPTDA